GLREIGREKEHDKEFDQFDRFELHGSNGNPELRAVDLMSKQQQQKKERERSDDPEILVGREATEARKCRAGRNREHEGHENPIQLFLRESRRQTRNDRETERRE